MPAITSFVLGTTNIGLNTSTGVYTIDRSIRNYTNLPRTSDGILYTVDGNFVNLFQEVQGTMSQSPINIKIGQSGTQYVQNTDTTQLVNGSNPVSQLVQVGVRDASGTTFLPFTVIKNIMLSNTGDDQYHPGVPVANVNALSCSTFMQNIRPGMNGDFCSNPNAITTDIFTNTFTTKAPPPTTTTLAPVKESLSQTSIAFIFVAIIVGIILFVIAFLLIRRRYINSTGLKSFVARNERSGR